MKVLEINNGTASFLIDQGYVSPQELSRDDLLYILNKIYENETECIEIPKTEVIKEIKNPIEQEIVQQIIQKISEFNINVKNIRQEVQSQFPPIEK